MDGNFALWALGPAIAGLLLACYPLVKWIGRRRTLWAAERIALSFSTDQSLMHAPPMLRNKLERYRVAKVRAILGASGSWHAAAGELVREHRLSMLERRYGR